MWELWSACKVPYWDKTQDQEVMNFVSNGGCLEWPALCPLHVYGVMLNCWARDREKRWVVCVSDRYMPFSA